MKLGTLVLIIAGLLATVGGFALGVFAGAGNHTVSGISATLTLGGIFAAAIGGIIGTQTSGSILAGNARGHVVLATIGGIAVILGCTLLLAVATETVKVEDLLIAFIMIFGGLVVVNVEVNKIHDHLVRVVG